MEFRKFALVTLLLQCWSLCQAQILGINQPYFRGVLSAIPFISNRNIEFQPTPGDSVSRPVVTINDGTLRGFTLRTVHGRAISAFQSIPYAKPPVGNLRFRDPIKNEYWNGTREAMGQSPQCIQLDFNRLLQVHGQEDCLYLNVYAPQRSPSKTGSLPVMVFIHGGAFFYGAGSIYGPRYLLTRDVILVTFNYRLGPFGFLSTGDDASPGNQGMKDQVLALKWVQENISKFGGDPTSVTIFGQSAGAGSVGLHLISPSSKGLFHRAISQTGSAFCYWADLYNASTSARKVGEFFKCPTNSSEEMVNCLRNVPDILLAPVQLLFIQWFLFPLVVFAPTVEHDHPGAFMTKHPEQYYEDGEATNVPWIAGLNSHEMSWFMSVIMRDPIHIFDINNDWDRVGPIMMGLNYNSTEINLERVRSAWEFYMGNNKLNWGTRHNFGRMFGDRFFEECTLEQMHYHSMYTKQPVFGYHFSYQGRYSSVQQSGANPANWGVAHLDDLIYLLNNPDYHQTLHPGDPELKMSTIMTNLWTNFASSGVPYLSMNSTRDIWQPIEPVTNILSPLRFLNLTLTPRMMEDPYLERYSFWRKMNANP